MKVEEQKSKNNRGDGGCCVFDFDMIGMAALRAAQTHAQSARFSEMLTVCQHILSAAGDNIGIFLDVGALLLKFGYLSLARECFERACRLAPTDLRPVINLANLARDAGEYATSRELFAVLLAQLPNVPVIRANALLSLEYDPEVSDFNRLTQACSWGEWAIRQVGSPRSRPPIRSLGGCPLRIGYVSSDFCQHTVGLFVKDVFKNHDSSRVAVFAYNAGQVKDWVTEEIRGACEFRDVAALDDTALANLIRQDELDILIDLSGHTAGSRLTVFVQRPAPVQVSWLGYFATTGLSCMDAVLLDEWHAPPGIDVQFVEPIVRLPAGRLCYQPVPWAPAEVGLPPCLKTGKVTFGCFNNSAKLNNRVFDLWAQILAGVPESRLVLKWRTFHDDALCRSIGNAFAVRGIAPERIDLRGPSFHADLLKEYADIDIALDPFPFTGGLTSCEALWMGVPIVTWPQSRVVSRQTFAFLSCMGLSELAARNAEEYVAIAVTLALNPARLKILRATLRGKMRASSLCDASGFTRGLEDALLALFERVTQNSATEGANLLNQKILLNVGAGHPRSGAMIPQAFQTSEWKELRLDIDPVSTPDILGSMLDISAVGDASVDAIYSSHNIEHLYPNEISIALKEFQRVLKPEGFVVITCPDLQAAAQMIADDRLMEVAYTSPAGPVTPFDIVYSHRLFTGRDKPYMAHHSGFTLQVLISTLKSNGFVSAAGKRQPAAFDLWVVATKSPMAEDELCELAGKMLPR
ncbi:MAG: methyltransferase domain-containing protein [Deltaproteobacteria bacterium]|nr:methyltransferase domain-containing protein [Deltaproteobacteria bacterium]